MWHNQPSSKKKFTFIVKTFIKKNPNWKKIDKNSPKLKIVWKCGKFFAKIKFPQNLENYFLKNREFVIKYYFTKF